MAGINPVIDPLLGELVSGPEAGANVTVDGFEVGVIGETGSGLYNAGDGIDIEGATISVSDRLKPAAVSELITGGTHMVDVTALRGALSAGQAVDVTSAPDNVTDDYRGTFSVTGSLGFASFPKFKSGLTYLMIADLAATTSGTVTPSGTWLDGTAAARSLAAGTSARVAMLFNAANKGKLTFSNTGSVSVSNCREYEVTSCTSEARAYIASLSDPDAFASYYLIKPDMVQPWIGIIDMGTSPAVTIASGLSYKLNAATGVHQLTVDTCPVGYDGRDAIIRITLGGSGVIQAVAPLRLGDALTPYAINNCVVRFRDGEAVLLVEDTLSGYIVTLTSGTGEGSLPYGLAASGVPYIAFSTSTDGIPVDLSGSTANGEKHIVGNGYAETTLTGAVDCGTSKFTVVNLALSNVGITGGTMTLGDAYIPSGSTVLIDGGRLEVERVNGDGGMINLGGTNIIVSSGATASASGCTFSGGAGITQGGTALYGGAVFNHGNATFIDCVFSGNSAQYGGVFYAPRGSATISGCTVSGNTESYGAILVQAAAKVTLIDSEISDRTSLLGTGTIELRGSNSINTIKALTQTTAGTVIISNGAVVDLTGTTDEIPIAPGGGIMFEGANQIKYGTTENPTTAYIDGCTATTIASGGSLFTGANIRLGGGTYSNVTFVGAPGYAVIPFGDTTLSNANCFQSSGNGMVFYPYHSMGGIIYDLTITLGGTCTIPLLVPQASAVTGGTVILQDNTTVNLSKQSYFNSKPITRLGTVIVGDNVKFSTGTNEYTITGGTYHNCSIDYQGNIIDA